MLYVRILLAALIPLLVVYYLFCVGQLFGLMKFTQREIVLWKAMIPFYYFIKSKKIKKERL